MVAVLRFDRDRQSLPEGQRFFQRIGHIDDEKPLAHMDQHVDDPHLLLEGPDALHGVVQGIAQNRIEIHRIHKVHLRPVRHAVDGDPAGLAEQALFRQHRVQGLVAGFDHRIVDMDGILNLPEVLLPPLAALHGAHGRHLVLQVMALPVDNIDGLPGHLVLGLLLMPEQVHGV